MRWLITLVVVATMSGLAPAQSIFDENPQAATKPTGAPSKPSTRPASELQALRDENQRLRHEIADLRARLVATSGADGRGLAGRQPARAPKAYKPGLLVEEKVRVDVPVGNTGDSIAKWELKDQFVTTSIAPFRFTAGRQARATGFIATPADGDYVFVFSGFSGLSLEGHGKMAMSKGNRILRTLKAGHVPIKVEGTEENAAGEVTVQWQLPGTQDLVPVPDEALVHQ